MLSLVQHKEYFNSKRKKISWTSLDDVLVLEEDVEQRRVLLEPLKVDVRRLLHPFQLGALGM